ncbi:hypothetical protein LTR62_000225 [Meristemomyces frigidus]|uniref:F-box domain-containing protein n=1 Tax=Meristemomyces frigidus TaxID=1508187 RepID=A0AAN7TS89_9PEZI|nr:hypothetical protein LTR62_000225 [Meristemomyces frigidus]
MSILDLPVDILVLIFPHLDASSFLNLTSTCKALHDPNFVNDSTYWSNNVRDTFRVPNQPQAQHDGKRWQKLYKRLRTQSRLYTWGNNEKACLGHSLNHNGPRSAGMRAAGRHRNHISWPGEMQGTDSLGVISDVQCGGWSTSLLTARGAVYAVGVLDGEQYNQRRPPYMQQAILQPTALRYPPGYAQAAERHDPSTAIKQFSAGRSHVLGLSDSGRIWSWQNVEHAALQVRFIHHDTKEDGSLSGRGSVHKVIAGWDKSAALIEGIGIVLWDPLKRGHDETEIEDAALVLESAVVPNTDYWQRRSNQSSRSSEVGSSLSESVGEVRSVVLLEHIVLFNTHLGKVYVSEIFWTDSEQRLGNPFELAVSNNDNEPEPAEVFVNDVQGSFRSFAVFLQDGTVLTSDQDRIMVLLQGRRTETPLFSRIPALQHKNVISVAFGDYHFHALHAPGYITSYGREPQACGALGLGGHGDPEGRLRGIRYQGMGGDGRLVPHAYSEGRRIWFEEEKRDWIKFLTAGGVNPAEAAERMRMALGSPDIHCQGEVSEWVEQQGRDWEDKFGLRSAEDDGLNAFFALSVTAAGWHSGALVLVNEELARKVQAVCEVRDPTLPERPEEEESSQRDSVAEDTTRTPPTYLATATSALSDWSRWFLGLPPYNTATSSTQPPSPSNMTPQQFRAHIRQRNDERNARTEQIHVPRNYGDSPREGYKYVWANDHFPRLVLSSGIEMPGEVGFDEWRWTRPGFDLEAGV